MERLVYSIITVQGLSMRSLCPSLRGLSPGASFWCWICLGLNSRDAPLLMRFLQTAPEMRDGESIVGTHLHWTGKQGRGLSGQCRDGLSFTIW